MTHIIKDTDTDVFAPARDKRYIEETGFSFEDVISVTDYGSLNNIISTYDFIFGKNAINYIHEHNKTTIKWSFRRYFKTIDK